MKINAFSGINNVDVEYRTPLGTCVEAKNVLLNGTGQVSRRPGSKNILEFPVVASYGTFDHSQMFVVTDSLAISRFDGESFTEVGAVSYNAACFWAEESPSRVFVAQRDSIQVWEGDQFFPLSTASNGLDTGTKELSITGSIVRINWVAGRLCVASYLEGVSRITFSVPGLYGRVSVEEDWFEIPYLVTGLESFATNLVITTSDAIFLYNTQTGILSKTVEYGTPVGRPISRHGADKALIWTKRGVITYPDWTNLTIGTYAKEPGDGCGASVMHIDGVDYMVCSHDSGGLLYGASL